MGEDGDERRFDFRKRIGPELAGAAPEELAATAELAAAPEELAATAELAGRRDALFIVDFFIADLRTLLGVRPIVPMRVSSRGTKNQLLKRTSAPEKPR